MSSPLSLFRKYQRLLLAVFGVLIMIVFVIGGSLVEYFQSQGDPRQSRGSDVVMTWNGGVVRDVQLQRMRRQHFLTLRFLEAVVNETTEASRTPQAEMIRPVQDERELLQRMLLAEKARQMGIVVSDQAVLDYLFELSDFEPNTDDPTSTEDMKRNLARLLRDATEGALSQPAMFDQLREELLARNMQVMAFSGVSFPPGQVLTPGKAWDYFTRMRRMVDVEMVPLDVQPFKEKVGEPSEADVRKLYEEYQAQIATPDSPDPGFREPLKINFGFVKGSMEPFLNEEMERIRPTITDEQIAEHYERNKENYRLPEEPAGQEPGNAAETPAPGTAPADTPGESPATPENEGAAAKPDGAKPDGAEPETGEKQGEKPDAEKPDAEQPQAAKPEAEKPDAEQPDAEQPEAEKPAGEEQSLRSSSASARFVVFQEQVGGEEEPAEEKPAEEKPADEKPADEKPADEKPADEKPAEEKPAEEKPAEEKPAEEKPAEEKPAEEKPADEKPAEEKPAEEKPAEEKPADEKPAEEKPADEKPAEEKPAEEKPAEEKPAEEKPAEEPQYRPLDEALREEIREELARQQAAEPANRQLSQVLDAARAALSEYSLLRPVEEDAAFPPFDLEQLYEKYTELAAAQEGDALKQAFREHLAEQFGAEIAQATIDHLMKVMPEIKAGRLEVGHTGPLGPFDVQEHELGRTFDFSGGQFRSFGQLEFGREQPLFRASSIRSFESDAEYLYWRTEVIPAGTPPLSEIRDEVVDQWKLREARELALQRARELAEEARKSGKSLAEQFGEQEGLEVVQPQPFSWMTRMGTGQPMLSRIQGPTDKGLEFAGPDFMRDVFSLNVGEVGVTANQPRTFVYVVRVADQTPSDDILREMFVMSGYRSPDLNRMALEDQAMIFRQWYEELEQEMGVRWPQTTGPSAGSL